MYKRISLYAVAFFAAVLLAGCATPREAHEQEIKTLNSRLNSLEAQASAKDEEAARLQRELSEQQAALAKADAERRAAEEQLEREKALAAAAKANKSNQDPYVK